MSVTSDLWSYLKEDALWPPGWPEEKRWTEKRAHLALGIGARSFGTHMKKFISDGDLTAIPIKIGTQFPTKVLCIGEVDPDELAECERRLTLREAIWDTKMIGAAGEIGVRRILSQAADYGAPFSNITQTNRLGRVPAGNLYADLTAIYRLSGGRKCRLLIECKNDRKVYMPRDDGQSAKLIEMASRANALPVFMCPYMDGPAQKLFDRIGIAYHVRGRQFLPGSMRAEIISEKLIPSDVLENYFEFIDIKRPRNDRMKPKMIADIKSAADPYWIERANEMWKLNKERGLIPEIIAHLKLKKIKELNELLDY